MKKNSYFVLATLVVSQAALAESEYAVLGRVGIVTHVTPPRGYIYKTDSSNWRNSHYAGSCPSEGDRSVLTLDVGTDAGRSLYATAVSAYLAGRRVKIWTDGCLDDLPRVVRLDIGAEPSKEELLQMLQDVKKKDEGTKKGGGLPKKGANK